MNRKPAVSKRTVPAPQPAPAPQKPAGHPPQFPLFGLLGLMGVVSITLAPAFYMIRGAQGETGAQLTGMLMILAGPLLLVIVVSSLLAIVRWWNQR